MNYELSIQSRNNPKSEIELLLCCTRTEISPAMAELIQNLAQQQLDWDYLLNIASQHGILPLLYRSLQQTCPKVIPPDVLSRLRDSSQKIALYNLFLVRELIAIVKLCQSRQIPLLPHKGPVVATLLYGNLTLREFCDLDILVLPADFFKVKALLAERGYQSRYAAAREDLEEICYRSYFECPLESRNSQVTVDLHQAFAEPYLLFSLKLEDLADELDSVSILGTPLPCLHRETLLIVLCMHGCKDGWQQLKWICDVAQLISSTPHLDWEQVWQQACRLASRRRLCLGLMLAHQLLGTPLPETIEQKIRADAKIEALAFQISKRLFSGTEMTVFERAFLNFALFDSLTDKVNHCIKYLVYLTLPNPRDLELVSLPVWLYFFYYFIHPIRLIRQYGKNFSREQ